MMRKSNLMFLTLVLSLCPAIAGAQWASKPDTLVSATVLRNFLLGPTPVPAGTIAATPVVADATATSVSASTRGTAQAVTKRPVTKEEFARAIEANDRRVLNVNADSIRVAHNRLHPNKQQFATRMDYADYIRTLVVRSCREGNTGSQPVALSRVIGSRVDIAGAWKRPLADGELCLYDNNEAQYMYSLSCGNHLLQRISVAAAMAPQPVPLAPEPRIVSVPSEPTYVDRPVYIQPTRRPGFCSRNKGLCTLIGAAIVGGGGYLIYDATRPKDIENINCNINGGTRSPNCPIQNPAGVRVNLNF